MIPLQYNTIFLLFFLFTIHSNLAQNNIEYEISGNNSLDDQFYIQCIEDYLSDTREIKGQLEKRLNDNGYFNFTIHEFDLDTLQNTNSIRVKLKISEGGQTYVRNIIIDSLSVKDSIKIYDSFFFIKNSVFTESAIEEIITELLSDYENNGFPFASIQVNSLKFGTDESGKEIVDIYLRLTKSEQRRINKVKIVGNTKTNDIVIINSARLINDEIYSQKRLEEIPIQLNKLRFFEPVKTPIFYINSNDEGVLQIEVKEKNTNSFDGIIGFVPATKKGEDGYLTGFVNIGLRNLFGTGRGLSFKWNQESSLTQELEIKYLEPWVFDQPFNINLDFFQRKQDSSYVKRIIGGSLDFLATNNITASVIIESESIIPSINNKNSLISNSSSFNSGIELVLDYRDDVYSPKSGIYFGSKYKFRSKDISSSDQISSLNPGNYEYHNYELDFGIFYSFFNAQVLALGVHAKSIIGDNYDLTDLFQFGGTNTLRGYRENQFLGTSIIWSNLEYRFLLSQLSYVFAFYDLGYYLIDENVGNSLTETSATNNGYGLGISLDTALGIMRVSYAFADGGSISNGLIHFGILNDF